MTAVVTTALLASLLTHPSPAPLPEPSERTAEVVAGAKLEAVVGRIARPEPAPQSSIETLICQQPWPCQQALRVARCESTLNPRAVSRGGHLGLFQLSPQLHAWRVGGDRSRLLNAADNTAAAYGLWRDSGGWGPWSCRP